MDTVTKAMASLVSFEKTIQEFDDWFSALTDIERAKFVMDVDNSLSSVDYVDNSENTWIAFICYFLNISQSIKTTLQSHGWKFKRQLWKHSSQPNRIAERPYYWCDRIIVTETIDNVHRVIEDTKFSTFDFTGWVRVSDPDSDISAGRVKTFRNMNDLIIELDKE